MRIGRGSLWLATLALLIVGCGGASSPSNSTDSTAANTPNTASSPAPEKRAERPEPKPIVIPADTVLSVTIDQAVSSKTSNNGDHFDASLAEPVTIDGREVLRTGTKVRGVVTDAKSAGRFKGSAELGLALDSITVEDKTYEVQTSSFGQSSKGRGKRTAIGAGGGAALGAIVGALAGGGKGAAIGAAAGGGAGSAGAAFTGKRDIEIPAETRLDFKLAQPLKIMRR